MQPDGLVIRGRKSLSAIFSGDGDMGVPPEDEPSLVSFLDAHPEQKELFPEEVLPSLERNWPFVRTHYRNKCSFEDNYIIRLQYGVQEEILYYLEVVLRSQIVHFRFNISLSYILCHKYKPRYRVFYASGNTALLDVMPFINSLSEIDECLERELRARDIEEELSSELPSSKWKLHSILSMTVYVAKLGGHIF